MSSESKPLRDEIFNDSNCICQKATQIQSVALLKRRKKRKFNGKTSGTQDIMYYVTAKVDGFAEWKYLDCFDENGYTISL